MVRKPSDEWSKIPAISFRPDPAPPAPAPAPAPPAPAPAPSAPVGKCQQEGGSCSEKLQNVYFRGSGSHFDHIIYFFPGGAVDPWTYGAYFLFKSTRDTRNIWRLPLLDDHHPVHYSTFSNQSLLIVFTCRLRD